jgi:predicted permease
MGELWRRIWYLLHRSRFERELREEMDAHRAMKKAGEAPFGNALRLREEAAEQWGWEWLERLRQDVRFALRLLVRAPAFTLSAVALLSVGIGFSLAAFQILDALALSWLPVREPQTLVTLHRRTPRGTSTAFSYPAFDFYRSHSTSLIGAMAIVHGGVTLGDDTAHHVGATFVTTNYFSELGATPLLGRLLDAADERPGADPVVVLSERLWRARFGGDRSLIGRPLRVNGHPHTLVGIVPESFVGLNDGARAWLPVTQHDVAFPGSRLLEDWDNSAIAFYGRISNGVSPAAVEATLLPNVRALGALRPREVEKDEWLSVLPAGKYLSIYEGLAAAGLMGALIALVLVTACMNLGLLVLSRTMGREREFSIRLSVGATRRRLARQLVTEHLLLGVIGAAAACFVSVQITRLFFVFTDAPIGLAPHFNARALGAAAVLAVVASNAFGFAPVWQTIRPAGTRRGRARNLLIAVQVAAASVLLIVSGLLVRGVVRVTRVPLGFDYEHAIVADPALASYSVNPGAALAYWNSVDDAVRHVPGIVNVAVSSLPPLGNRVSINRDGTVFYHVTPSYFDTMRIPLRRGRLFVAGEKGVVLISEALARRRWNGEDPIGKTFAESTVIGIVGDARTVRLSDGNATECYRAIGPGQMPDAVLVVRVSGDPRPVTAQVASVLRSRDERLSPSVNLLGDLLDERLSGARQVAAVTSVLGVSALLLAVTGLAGLVAFTVSQRRREIGVRLALGARPRDVVRAIGRQFAQPVLSGAVVGMGLAAGAGFVLSRELYGVSYLDPIAHVGALLLFISVAAVAALPSIRRALRVDPIQTLRHE